MRQYKFEELQYAGWLVDETRGVQTRRFSSIQLCLDRDGFRVASVQGYGQSSEEAILDAVSEANRWIRRQKPATLASWAPALLELAG